MRKIIAITALTASALLAPLAGPPHAEEHARALICWGSAGSEFEQCHLTELDCSDFGLPGGGSTTDSGGTFECDQFFTAPKSAPTPGGGGGTTF